MISFAARLLVLPCVLLTSICVGQVANDAAPPSPRPDVIFVPTPARVVDLMLRMAKVKKDDVVYDLGCGDGRLVTLAAKNFGARGVGIEIDPKLVAEARNFATAAKVADRVEFRVGDLFKSDFRDATVVMLYLQDHLNVRLRPLIFAQAKPGTRIVSHMFRMGDWQPTAEESVALEGTNYEAFLWVVPANLSGRWKLHSRGSGSGMPLEFVIEQKFQRFTVRRIERAEIIGEGTISGNDFTVTIDAAEEKKRLTFTGTFDRTQLTASRSGTARRWTANREPGTEQPLEPPPKN